MKVALLFPGQGSQGVGMGKELYETTTAAREVLDNACSILGYDLKKLMFEGPLELLTDTKVAQPAIFTCSAMHLERAKELGVEYEYVAGHSLGEYSALYASGIISFEEGLKLVDKRGRAMAEQNGKGTMAAVLGLTEAELDEYLDQNVVMANLNTKTQIVISGTIDGIDSTEKRLQAMIDKEEIKFKRLQVSSAFHSPLMAEAADVMRAEIDRTVLHTPNCAVVSNVTGKETTDLTEIKDNLIKQITGQVRWYESIVRLKELGVEQFYEVGNGEVLKKMNKAITIRPKCLSI